ncbi:MAG: DUF6029 family protein [Candidatus Electryonea clarkiae]|nr:DUF6029 family protein [Candidatus Electryonea clarkiae]MDP8289253.1 DUF6029 family protein [Candidatus Electryonea clarkiae]
MNRIVVYHIFCISLLILISQPALSQQVNIQGNNELKWADGLEELSGESTSKRYFENRLNLDLYYDKIRFGSRFTMLQPSEFGQEISGVETFEKRFLEFRDPDNDMYFRVGNFYTVWGRGLSLALSEDITQGFDSGLDGVLAGGDWEFFEAEVISGRSDAGHLGLVREAQISGANISAAILDNATLGALVVLTDSVGLSTYTENRTWGGYGSYDGSYVSVWAEHSMEFVTGVDEDNYASYASISGFYDNIGIALDYKNYNYYWYGSRGANSAYAASTGVLPFHSPPIVQREFTSNLFSKHPHLIKYEDEVGAQLEITWSPGSWGTMVLAYAQSSSHPENDAPIPSLKEVDSPYRELFLEVNAYPGWDAALSGWGGWSEEVIYYRLSDVRQRWRNQAVLGGRLEMPVFGQFSEIVSAEGMIVSDKILDKSFPEARFEAGGVYKANYSLVASLEMSDENEKDYGFETWFNVQGRAMIAGRHELIFMYGQERGGLVCSSGKCRVVTPFNGVKISLISLF